MTILMLHSEDSAVGMYRIWQPGKYLQRLGHQVRLLPDKAVKVKVDHTDGEQSWEDLADGADLIVIQRPDSAEMLALALAMRDQYQIPLVYEIDDNIYDISTSSPSYQYWFPGSPLFDIAEILMHEADAITVTTEALAKVYAPLNKHIYVLPNCQDPEIWEGIVRPKTDKHIIIGWAGGESHYDDLRILRRPIKKILRNNKNVRFRVMGTLPDFLDGIEGVQFRTDVVHTRKWPAKLAELDFDIGVAPVVERPFNTCKSNIKWQEYAMLEIPTVASRFGPYMSIEHNENGMLANNNEYSWELWLTKLIEDEKLRSRIGKAAKQSVLKNYNMATGISRYQEAYLDVIDRFKSQPREGKPRIALGLRIPTA